jgi:predicted nuclease with RNAse H fold
VKVLGVDLAAEPGATAVCRIDWEGGEARAEVSAGPVDDQAIVEVAATADKVGVDAPFGWSDEFVDAICAHHEFRPWPGRAQDHPGAYRRRLRFRRTDEVVRAATGIVPLSVSSDLIAVPAMRCALLQDRLAEAWGAPVDRTGAGRLVEVYPAGTLCTWRLPYRGYKGRSHRPVLAALVDRLLAALPALVLDGDGEQRCRTSDHAFDALVAALVAVAATRRLTRLPVAGEEEERARREGWIHLPLDDHPTGLFRSPPPGGGDR